MPEEFYINNTSTGETTKVTKEEYKAVHDANYLNAQSPEEKKGNHRLPDRNKSKYGHKLVGIKGRLQAIRFHGSSGIKVSEKNSNYKMHR